VICIVDYGAGNLRSVTNVLDVIGADYKLVNDEAAIRAANKIVLPGVGHFGQLVAALDQLKIRQALIDQIKNGVAYLGICLGMQVLFADSQEASTAKGLGIFSGSVRKFESADRSVHMGWNTLEATAPSQLVKPLPTDSASDSALFAYYAHSFFCPVVDQTVMTTSYGDQFSAVIEFENVYGVQFHPEKSGDFGRLVMQNFVGI
jgi:imidazole glycerol phosphate synthase glutamine amidotransferase subunit